MRILLALLSLFLFLPAATGKEVRVYKGDSHFLDDVICTVRDGSLYKGRSSFRSDIVATLRDGHVYRGTSPYRSDIIFTIDGSLTFPEFIAVWYAVNYIY